MVFTKGDPALMLTYQTDLAIEDTVALRREAEDIWQVFRNQVEQVGLKNAILSAREAPTGILIKKSRHYNFIAIKDEVGLWRFQ